MAATDAETATNQALRFANALRWERGQRKESEERLEAANAELGQTRQLNKKLTAELQATSALLNSAAKAAELLQKQKEKTRQLESQLRAATRELDAVRESGATAGSGRNASVIRPDEHEMLLDALQRQQKDAAELRELLAARDEELASLRSDGVQVKSPLKMDPAELLRDAPRAAMRMGNDPVIQSLWSDDGAAEDSQGRQTIGRAGRAPLGSLDNNAMSFSTQKPKPYVQPRIGRGCTCGGCSMDDAGNYRLMCGTASGSVQAEAETVLDLGGDVDDDDEHDEFGAGHVGIVEGSDGDLAELDLAGAEENANTFDHAASKSGFGEDPVPGGHAPYYCTSLDCELAVVKQLGWEAGAGTAAEDEGDPAGCGRVMEGQLRFDSARYGAALDIVFTGSVEHLRDQEWQNDKSAVECACCQSHFTLLNRRHHCRVCGVIYCSDCLLRSLPYFVPEEEEEPGPQMAAEQGADFRSSLALTVCDQDGPEIPGTMPGQVKRAAILSCHTCFSMLQLLAVAQAGPKTSGLRFNMCHAGS